MLSVYQRCSPHLYGVAVLWTVPIRIVQPMQKATSGVLLSQYPCTHKNCQGKPGSADARRYVLKCGLTIAAQSSFPHKVPLQGIWVFLYNPPYLKILFYSNENFVWEIHTCLGSMRWLERPSIQSRARDSLVLDLDAAIPVFPKTTIFEEPPIDGDTLFSKNATP